MCWSASRSTRRTAARAAQAFELAWKQITERNPFPAVCGRVCQHPCELGVQPQGEGRRRRHPPDRALPRRLRDRARVQAHQAAMARALKKLPSWAPARRDSPAPTTWRGAGYAVTVFEAAPQPGGMMRYRMPRSVIPGEVLDAEIGNLLDLGVEIKCGSAIGRDVTVADLRRDHAAVFFAMGLQKPSQLALQRDGEGAAVVGEPLTGAPGGPYAEVSELDARVANTISPAIAQGRAVAEAIARFSARAPAGDQSRASARDQGGADEARTGIRRRRRTPRFPPQSSSASPKPSWSKKPSAACRAACAWTAKPAGCTAAPIVSRNFLKASITRSSSNSATAARSVPKHALADISN